MARELWLLRHGDAEPHGARPDADRRLTASGRDQAVAAGGALAALGVEFGIVLSSPRERALETARLAAEPVGLTPSVHEPLSAGFAAREALELAAAQDDDRRLLLVGHEPDFSQVVAELTGARIALKKGGLAAIRCEDRRCELMLLVRPRELRAIC